MPHRGAIVRLALIAALVVAATVATPAPGAGGKPTQRGSWLAGDLHVHTCFSHDAYCGPSDDNTGPEEAYTAGLTVQEQFCAASQRGLDFLAITDHEDVRSQADPGFGACGVLPVPGYEASYRGHAQALGATAVLDTGDDSLERIQAAAAELRAAGGVFQINHPANGSTDFPNDADWGYGYELAPDTVETWNISNLWQPPMPSGSSNDDAIRYWEGWLDRGFPVGATGGSDNHYRATQALQGPGQPTTHVFARKPTLRGVLDGLAAGRTFISWEPPALGGPLLFLEGDRHGDGDFESMVGDTVPPGSSLRVRVDGAPGAMLRVVTDGGTEAFPPAAVDGASFEHRFTLPAEATWVRAEVV
ncbi:MAG: CehA/McbA family metallohydrolase, partial [Actinomycetota bacterium]|nr:CehA/McbA family metallohydrolase [Actinomycetota bacterium]